MINSHDNGRAYYKNPFDECFDARYPCIYKASNLWSIGSLPDVRFIIFVA